MGDGRGMVAVSAGCECMGDTRGSGVVSGADDVLEMSVVLGVRGVGGVYESVCGWLWAGWKLLV